MKVAIIGGGWVGCHLTKLLLSHNIEVTLFEKNSHLLSEASYVNQCRLHLGFHYPRSGATISEQIVNYSRFIEEYPTMNYQIDKNIYAIASNESYIDFDSFVRILISYELKFTKINYKEFSLRNVDGALSCEERVIDNVKASEYFRKILNSNLKLNTLIDHFKISSNKVVIENQEYDFLINATQNISWPCNTDEFKYEVCMMALYQSNNSINNTAITIMDGPFVSLYPSPHPSIKDLFWLSGVKETVLSTFNSAEEAKEYLAYCKALNKHLRKDLLEEKTKFFLPNFKKQFNFVKECYTIKTKPKHDTDSRRWHNVAFDGPVIHTYASKISQILPIGDKVLEIFGIYKDYQISR